jgi:branched-chain amino acid aminotransferase
MLIVDVSYRKYYLYNEDIKESENFNDEFMLKGKSLYEVIRIIDGVPVFLEEHMNRLNNSEKLMDLKLPYGIEEIKERIYKLIKENHCDLGNIKLVFNFFDKKCDFYAYFLKHNYPEKSDYLNGVETIFFHGERDNPNAKVINLSFRDRVDAKIKEKQVYEAILVDRNGNITEGSRSNIFMIEKNNVFTSPMEKVLPGITRDIIIKVIKKCGYSVIEKEFNYKNIDRLDGMFISGTSPQVLPIKSVENVKFNSADNEVIKNIMAGYDKEIEEYIRKNKIKE